MSEEDNLIEELKRSLKLTENEYLKSEIEDLKEFFNVQTRELIENELYETDCNGSSINNEKKCFWLEVSLPVTLRKITKEGKEILINEKPVISFKIKLKNGKCVAIAVKEQLEEVKEHENVKDAQEEDVHVHVEEVKEEETDEKESTEIIPSNSEDNLSVNDNNSVTCDDSLPYEIIEVKVSELNEEADKDKLTELFESLIHPNDIPLLSVIEEFYIKLEEYNYPAKTVICRDYYYPVFDSRHWGRSQSLNPEPDANNNNSSPNNNNNFSLSYRARALYDFQALMQGELSFQENEILVVLANLGNGWLTARRTSTSSAQVNELSDDTIAGLIPENYIERL